MAASINPSSQDSARVRAALADGRLPELLHTARPGELAALYLLVHDLVHKIIQPRERRAGHPHCATAPERMEPACRDRFLDTVEVVREDLVKHGTTPIANPEGWMVARFNAVTVDANRRRRGEVGALQRPRMPQWLERRLDSPWRLRLALEIMTWVGVPHSAGLGVWPLRAWAELRDELTGAGGGEAAVAADVDAVLAAMRTNGGWFDDYIERPLGRKQPGVLPAQRGPGERVPDDLPLVGEDERVDARLHDLAADAVAAIAARVAAGADLTATVRSVIATVFTGGSDADRLAEVPGAGTDHAEQVRRLLADPATVRRVAEAVAGILAEQGEATVDSPTKW